MILHRSKPFAIFGMGVLLTLILPQAASSPQDTSPRIELRAVSSSCYEFSVRDARIPADGWHVGFRFGGSDCLTLSSFSEAEGEVIGIVCCQGVVLLCQDQLMVTGSQAGRPVFTVSRTIHCP
ncbi:MAG: hypothetical protein D6723_19470 [Acidobacteria bacterium]|nr:MAG: hypothetical protein D6723_19470 [Acidobacteriota bacterium]